MAAYDKEAYIEQQKTRTTELTDKLESGMKELLNSDKYRDYLKTMSHFHNYSSRNIMLIKQQKPDATRVASFSLWKEKFKRQVKGGEKGLYIYAPIGEKKPETKLMEKLDPETGVPLLDKDGKVIMEEMTTLGSGPRFKLVPVFDVRQTHGEPLPELAEDLTGNVAHYEAFMDALKAVSPLPIEFEQMSPGQDGYCRFGDKIGIREGMSEPQTVAAVIHEITHARLHDKSSLPENAKPKNKTVKEIESESVAYVVSQRFSVETAPNSFGYIAEYGSQDMSELKASLDTIRKEANGLITAIEGKFLSICKERGIDLSAKEAEQTAPAPQKEAVPEYTAETRTENIAGMDFEIHEVIPQASEKIQDSPAADPPTKTADNGQDRRKVAPDLSISEQERDMYGFTDNTILPLRKDRAAELLEQDFTVYLLYPDNTEAMVFEQSDIDAHDGLFGVEEADWYQSQAHADMVSQHSESFMEAELVHGGNDAFGIYQLKSIDETRDYRFEGLESLQQRGLAVDRGNYVLAYTAPMPPSETLEGIYQQFNADRPQDFTGHSLSVSDVIVIHKDGDITSHFVDSYGFSELPSFLGIEKQQEHTSHAAEHRETENKASPAIAPPEPPAAVPASVRQNPIDVPLYRHPPETARENGELDIYRQNANLNRECANAIDKAIYGSNYKPNHYDLKSAAQTVIAEYGKERVDWVLANTIQKQHYDGRYSSTNNDWAKGFDIPENASGFFANAHPVLVNSFIDRVQEAEREKPSLLDTLSKNEQKSRQQFGNKPEPGREAPKKNKNEQEV